MRGPNSEGSTPFATCAAAGAKTSRPWNVRDTGVSMNRSSAISYAPVTPPLAAAAGMSRPLSGPTKTSPQPVSTTIALRVDPTLGSTTARWTESGR